MRTLPFLLALALVVLAGCSSPPTSSQNRAPANPPRAGGLIVTPTAPAIGKVATVNEASRYVIVELDLTQKVNPGQTYAVYRNRLKVGEIRITGPQDGDVTAADILQGQVKRGDDVQAE